MDSDTTVGIDTTVGTDIIDGTVGITMDFTILTSTAATAHILMEVVSEVDSIVHITVTIIMHIVLHHIGEGMDLLPIIFKMQILRM